MRRPRRRTERERLRSVYSSMISRCEKPAASHYCYYGARGIRVCARWRESFAHVLADMGPRPHGMQLDRIDNDRGYGPGNCRWVTRSEQQRNKRNSRRLTLHGETMTQAEWAERTGLAPQVLHNRIAAGWTVERALCTPAVVPMRFVTIDGVTRRVREWARVSGTPISTILSRLNRGADGRAAVFSAARQATP